MQMITEWLDKHGDPQIEKIVEEQAIKIHKQTMKTFLIGDTIYKYIANTWVQAEKMLATELGVSVWELPSFKFTRYEL